MTLRAFLLHHVSVLEQDGGFSGETDVLVEGGVVSAVGAALSAPPDAPVYDFSGLWLMPGVFDCHAHVAMSTMNESELLRTPPSYGVFEAARNLRATLDAGVTHLRDAGGADAGAARAVAEGLAPGPRLQICVKLLSQTGGHGDMYSERLGVEPDPVFERHADDRRRRGGRPPRRPPPAPRRRGLDQAGHHAAA